jgi:hypothetical protein
LEVILDTGAEKLMTDWLWELVDARVKFRPSIRITPYELKL